MIQVALICDECSTTGPCADAVGSASIRTLFRNLRIQAKKKGWDRPKLPRPSDGVKILYDLCPDCTKSTKPFKYVGVTR